MSSIKDSSLFKALALILILTFISLDISYANSTEHNANNSTLAVPSVLQEHPINSQAALFQRAMTSNSVLLASVLDIGDYFFGNSDKGIAPLPAKHAEYNAKAGLQEQLSGAGIEILKIVPVEELKATPQELRSALDEINFKGELPKAGVIFVLYRKDGREFLLQIARKGEILPEDLPGYDRPVSDKYVVKCIPQDYGTRLDATRTSDIFKRAHIIPSYTIRKDGLASSPPDILSSVEVSCVSIDEAEQFVAPKPHKADHVTYHLRRIGENIMNLASPSIKDVIDDPESDLYKIVMLLNPEYVSIHLGWSVEDVALGVKDHHDMPASEKSKRLSRSELADRIIANLKTLQKNLAKAGYNKPILIETLDYHEGGAYEIVTDPDFIQEVVNGSGARLLIDFGHLLCSAKNNGMYPPERYMDYVKSIVNAETVGLIDEFHIAVPEARGPRQYEDVHRPFTSLDTAGQEFREIMRYIFGLRAQQGITNYVIVNFETGIANAENETRELAAELARSAEEANAARKANSTLSSTQRAVINDKGQILMNFLAAREAYSVDEDRWVPISGEDALLASGPFDAMVVMGSSDERVPKETAAIAIKLREQNPEITIITSGKWGKSTYGMAGYYVDEAGQRIPEAEHFKRIMEALGAKIDITEGLSTNSGQNIQFSRDKIIGAGLKPARILVVQTPELQKRAGRSTALQYPTEEASKGKFTKEALALMGVKSITSYSSYIPQLSSMDDAPAVSRVRMAIAELQRYPDYVEKNKFMVPTEIPPAVLEAIKILQALLPPDPKPISGPGSENGKSAGEEVAQAPRFEILEPRTLLNGSVVELSQPPLIDQSAIPVMQVGLNPGGSDSQSLVTSAPLATEPISVTQVQLDAASYTTADITNLKPTSREIVLISTSTNKAAKAVRSLRGMRLTYDNDVGGAPSNVSTFGFQYRRAVDIDTKLSGSDKLIFGFKGDGGTAILEITDSYGAKARFTVDGITPGDEKVQSFMLADIRAQGVDTDHLIAIKVAVEGPGKKGVLEFNWTPDPFSVPSGARIISVDLEDQTAQVSFNGKTEKIYKNVKVLARGQRIPDRSYSYIYAHGDSGERVIGQLRQQANGGYLIFQDTPLISIDSTTQDITTIDLKTKIMTVGNSRGITLKYTQVSVIDPTILTRAQRYPKIATYIDPLGRSWNVHGNYSSMANANYQAARSGAYIVVSKLTNARDRAIFAASPRGAVLGEINITARRVYYTVDYKGAKSLWSFDLDSGLALKYVKPALVVLPGGVQYIAIHFPSTGEPVAQLTAPNGDIVRLLLEGSEEPVVPNQPSIVSVDAGDRRLFVQDRLSDGSLGQEYAFVSKGVNWSPASIGGALSDMHLEFAKWYRTDIPLMAQMGVNVVRVYHDFGTGQEATDILDMLYSYGIKVIMTVDSPRHGVIADTANITSVVNAYKNHPAILMWAVGNEWDLNNYYGTYSSIEESAQFIEQAAQLIKSLDANHPVMSVIGDIDRAGLNPLGIASNIVNNLVPSVDLWGLNIYRGSSLGAVFGQWKTISSKPMVIAEFGADSYDHRISAENQAMQASVNSALWDETFFDLSAYRTDGAAVGMLAFEWNDEWWKSGNASSHDKSYQISYGQPDLYSDEEYYGLVDINRNLKSTYYQMQDRYTNGQSAVDLIASPTIRVTSQGNQSGASEFYVNDKPVFYRGGGGGGGRGISVAILDRYTGIRIEDARTFDTWTGQGGFGGLHTNFQQLVNYLNGLPNGTVIALSVCDEGGFTAPDGTPWPNDPYVTAAYQALEALGSTQVRNVDYWGGWAMVTVKGTGVVAEAYSAPGARVTINAQVSLTLDPDHGLRPATPVPAPAEPAVAADIPQTIKAGPNETLQLFAMIASSMSDNSGNPIQFEADSVMGSLIFLARKAKKDNQALVIGLETDWIPGLDAKTSLQNQAITVLMQEIDNIAQALRSMGLDNVQIIHGSKDELASSILKASTSMNNVIVMASKDTLDSDSFKDFRNRSEGDRPFLAGINPSELIKLYSQYGESLRSQLHIELTSLLYMVVEAAAGKEPPNAPWIQYDKVMRILILMPGAQIMDYEKLKNSYKAEVIALQAA